MTIRAQINRNGNYSQLVYSSPEQLEQIRNGEIFLSSHRGFTWYFQEVSTTDSLGLPEGVAVFQYYGESSKATRYKGIFRLVQGEEKRIYCGEELKKYILLKFTHLLSGVNPQTKHNGTSDLGAYIRAIPQEFLADETFLSKFEGTAKRVIDKRIEKTSNLEEIEALGDLADFVKKQIVSASGAVKKVDKDTTVMASKEEIERARQTAKEQTSKALGDGKK